MQSKEKDNLIFARMFPEEDIYQSFHKLLEKHQVKTAIVLSGIGQIKDITLGFFKEKGDYLPEKMKGAFELLSLSGNMSQQNNTPDFHLHATIADKDKKAFGGHLITGVVSITLELVLLKTELSVERRVEEETGLQGLFLN